MLGTCGLFPIKGIVFQKNEFDGIKMTKILIFPFSFQYVARLQAGEKPLQVLQNLQISDGDKNGSMTLLRDQIVVQVSFM